VTRVTTKHSGAIVGVGPLRCIYSGGATAKEMKKSARWERGREMESIYT
jgi:hypothetical protein